ncbi:hypothetical protein J2W23_001513 [Variovorax boronicumulans]|uniref:SMI1/KNR4 family protein n=1 Tax=Variovorax boronicumulans TaxID=436515 RepID=UPI00278918FE|nr:SMI1/KNR4 family protein [Variovorax boronicumulans]MDQ0013134.1 hypothetical protein [Variovorax boronicumulans]
MNDRLLPFPPISDLDSSSSASRPSFRSRLLASLCALFMLSGCGDEADPSPKVEGTKTTIQLRDRHSAYAGNSRDWSVFMDCWRKSSFELYSTKPEAARGLRHLMVLGQQTPGGPPGPTETELKTGLAQLEARLKMELPKSYKDFWIAYKSQALAPSGFDPHNRSRFVGMLELDDVGLFKDLEPDYWALMQTVPIHSGDHEYFSYGVAQDSISGRTSDYGRAILIGKYADDSTALILLHPHVRTSDGEMQASLNEHAGEFRAPSFAELMRQLSILETVDVKHVPPYSQKMLADRCAARLPMKNVWWD